MPVGAQKTRSHRPYPSLSRSATRSLRMVISGMVGLRENALRIQTHTTWYSCTIGTSQCDSFMHVCMQFSRWTMLKVCISLGRVFGHAPCRQVLSKQVDFKPQMPKCLKSSKPITHSLCSLILFPYFKIQVCIHWYSQAKGYKCYIPYSYACTDDL